MIRPTIKGVIMGFFSNFFGRGASSAEQDLPDVLDSEDSKSYVTRVGETMITALRKAGLQPVSSYYMTEITRDGPRPESLVICFAQKNGSMGMVEVFKEKTTYQSMDDASSFIVDTPREITQQVIANNRAFQPAVR